MEVYLRQDKDTIRFPITPSVIGVKNGASIETSNIIKLGEMAIFNGRKLKTFDSKSFFPNQEYDFCNYRGFSKPYDFVKKIKKWVDNGYILRITVTETDINFECIISDFTYTEQDGTGDVYFELSVIEYKRLQIPSITDKLNSSTNASRPSKPTTTQKTHRVVKGDNLWDISKRYYGKGSDYKKINQKNWDKYPSLKKNNVIYPNWVLLL